MGTLVPHPRLARTTFPIAAPDRVVSDMVRILLAHPRNAAWRPLLRAAGFTPAEIDILGPQALTDAALIAIGRGIDADAAEAVPWWEEALAEEPCA